MKQIRVGSLVFVSLALLLALVACGKPQQGAAPTAAPTLVPSAQGAAPTAAPTQPVPTVASTAATTIPTTASATVPTATASPTTAIPTATPAAEQDDAGSGADAPNSVVAALEIQLDTPFAGLLAEDDEEDWYTFVVDDGAILQIAFGADAMSDGLSAYLLDTDRNEVADAYRVTPGREASLRYILNASGGGGFYLRVTGQGAYTFEVSGPLQGDTGAFGDAADTLVDAVEFEPDKIIEGLLGDMDEQDWYVAPLAHGAIIEIAFTPGRTAEAPSLYLYNPDQEEIWSAYHVTGGTTKTVRYLLSATSGGPYYLEVGGLAGDYTVDFKASQQDDAGLSVDAPQDDDALGIPLNEALNGELGDADEEDWYSFDPAEGMTIHFTPAKGSKNLSIYLLDGNRDAIWDGYHIVAEKTVSYTLEEITEGNYIIRITGGTGAYTFKVQEQSPS